MTILNWIRIKCPCEHVFQFELPQSITSWLYPEMVQKLLDGGYYRGECPNCNQKIIVNGEIMINSPKGIVLVQTGPPEDVKSILQHLDIVDETGIPYSSEILYEKLRANQEQKKRI